MAPSLSTATGLLQQQIDDPRLVQLRDEARQVEIGDVSQLVELLTPVQEWNFQEQVSSLLNEHVCVFLFLRRREFLRCVCVCVCLRFC